MSTVYTTLLLDRNSKVDVNFNKVANSDEIAMWIWGDQNSSTIHATPKQLGQIADHIVKYLVDNNLVDQEIDSPLASATNQ